MERKTLITLIAASVVLILLSGVIFVRISRANGETLFGDSAQASATSTGPGDENNDTYDPAAESDNGTGVGNSTDEMTPVPSPTEVPFVPAAEMDLDPASITVFVNKEYALPKDYRPDDLVTPNVTFNLITYDERTLMRKEAAEALEQLFAAAEREGHILYGVSAYRSYARQKTIFLNNIVRKGKDYTLRYSAVPGTSEHQTGLSIDVSVKSQGFRLDDNFADSTEGKWLAENAHNYGYIIRYPKGYEEITGYAFEPWHIRYVGKALATYLYDNGLTLEEYYHYEPGEDFDFEATYASLINYKAPTATPIPEDNEDVVLGEDGEIIDIGDGDVIEDPEDGEADGEDADEGDTDGEDTGEEDPDNGDAGEEDPNSEDTGSEDAGTGNHGGKGSDNPGTDPSGGSGNTPGSEDGAGNYEAGLDEQGQPIE